MSHQYCIETRTIHGVDVVRLRDNDDTHADVVPAWGGSCMAFVVQGSPVLEHVPLEVVARKPTSYGMPILFPFPNRIRDGAFGFQGKRYVVEPSRHGFVRHLPWRLVGTDASDLDGARIHVSLDARDFADEILVQFPFPFRLEACYTLRDRALSATFVAINTGEADMPIGLGLHPYLACSSDDGLVVPASKRWEAEDGMPTGQLVDVGHDHDLRTPRAVRDVTLDDVYTGLTADFDGLVSCGVGRTVVQFALSEFPHVAVYTPPDRHAVCIEPYSCATDAFNLCDRGVDAGGVVLGAGETRGFEFAIR